MPRHEQIRRLILGSVAFFLCSIIFFAVGRVVSTPTGYLLYIPGYLGVSIIPGTAALAAIVAIACLCIYTLIKRLGKLAEGVLASIYIIFLAIPVCYYLEPILAIPEVISYPIVIVLLYVLLRWTSLGDPLSRLASWWTTISFRSRALLISALGLLVLIPIRLYLYGFGNYHYDESAQIFQARIFLRGLVKLPTPAGGLFFKEDILVVDETGYYAQYFLGYILLLIPFEALHIGWLTNIALGIGTLIATYNIGRHVYTESVALLSVLILIISPSFLVWQTSQMNHGGAIFFLTVALLLVLNIKESNRPLLFAALIGFTLGFATIIRPLTALGYAVPLFAYSLFYVFPMLQRRVAVIALFVTVYTAMVSLQLLYNLLQTGNALTSGYHLSNPALHRLGFHESMNLPRAVGNTINSLYAMNHWLLWAPSGVYLPIIAAYLLRGFDRFDWLFLSLHLGLVAAYFFYQYHDVFYGPRFLYESIVPLSLLLGRAIVDLCQRSHHLLSVFAVRSPGISYIVLFGILFAIPNILAFSDYARYVHIDARQGVGRVRAEVAAAKLPENAILILDHRYRHAMLPEMARYPEGRLYLKPAPMEDLRKAYPDREIYYFPEGGFIVPYVPELFAE